ncbi:MAG TPA: hypothetical protein VGP36_13000 [Mycobacteriales bacterium]|nr:hypothetical protein [Mycobacteriales bacterium]
MRIHLPALDHPRMDPGQARYAVEVNGHLGVTALSAFPAMVAQCRGPRTVLVGLLDQSALYGVVAQLEALGLELLEIRRLTLDGVAEPDDGCLP